MRAMARRSVPAILAVLAVSCAPFGEGVLGGGDSTSSFSSVGSPVAVPPGSADSQAHDLLLRALGDAIQAAANAGGSFATVDLKALASIDPELRAVGDVPASVGVVSIDLASKDGIVLSTRSRSGTTFCLSMVSATGVAIPEGGTVDAQGATSVTDCTGKDWMFAP
jgi:hypothetical protein